MLHVQPEVLPFEKSSGGICPKTKLLSQSVVQLAFMLGTYIYQYQAVVADIDVPCIVGADFMVEHQLNIRFTRKSGKVTVGTTGKTFSLKI